MTGFAVSPVELRRAAAALRAVAEPFAAGPPGWAASAALDSVIAAAGTRLGHLAGEVEQLAEALVRVAGAYERADEEAADRFRTLPSVLP
jgi:Excreted virulence factor EspC, type VII ESX diderm